MKSKPEIIIEAKGYFEKYPKEQKVFTTGDGNFFLSGSESTAKGHARQSKKDLITITREESENKKASKKSENEKVVIPEGEPSKVWTKDELIAFGAKEYPELKLSKSMKEETILKNLDKAKASKGSASGDDSKGSTLEGSE